MIHSQVRLNSWLFFLLTGLAAVLMVFSLFLYLIPPKPTTQTNQSVWEKSGQTKTQIKDFNKPLTITLTDPATARLRVRLPEGERDFYITPASLIQVITYTSQPEQPPEAMVSQVSNRLVWQVLQVGDKVKLSVDQNNNVLALVIEK